MDICNFISELEKIKNSGYIYNYNGLVNSLNKLNGLIGMKEVKTSIISQIKYYIVNKSKNVDSLNMHMFHTTVIGPPGCGKTTLVEILAEVWVCLGILKNTSNVEIDVKSVSSKELDKLISSNIVLTAKNLYYKSKLEDIRKEIFMERIKIISAKKNLNDIYYRDKNKALLSVSRKLESVSTNINLTFKNLKDIEIVNIPPVEDTDYKTLEDKESKENKSFNPSDFILKLKRNDLIGKYVGHTAIKTREALLKGLNKVIFIDEAYELYNTQNDTDSFGMECLSTILNFMNEFSDKCIIVFAGYENLLKETIFRVQPGLERRISWVYEIKSYSIEELVDIYENQLQKEKINPLRLKNKDKIISLFRQNKKLFKFAGGDCIRLCMFTKIVYSNKSFEKILIGESEDSEISEEIVSKAIDMLKHNIETQSMKIDEPPFGMYI